MRISDWSSDVCSSDLPADVQPRLPAINAALTAGYAAGSTMAGDGCRRAPPMTQFAEHVYTAQHDIARIESWAGQLEDEARVEILLADGARVEGVVAARRSEEHTSELQSLKRISSAVFCLKKKKKPLIKNINSLDTKNCKKTNKILYKYT